MPTLARQCRTLICAIGTDAGESLLACHFSKRKYLVGVAKRPKAPDCGSGIRGFESHHPPHKKESSIRYSLFYLGICGGMGFEEADPCLQGIKSVRWTLFKAGGESHHPPHENAVDRSRRRFQRNPPLRVDEIIFDDEGPCGDEIRLDGGWADFICACRFHPYEARISSKAVSV